MADSNEVRTLVERAVKAAVPPDGMVQKKIRPESEITWPSPAPLAGLRAAQEVIRLANEALHRFALDLRGEGQSWEQVADLMGIPWSSEYVQRERAYELVLGPDPEGTRWHPSNLYWTCAGPDG